jgi:Leucine-rich repeat (LRR) protein
MKTKSLLSLRVAGAVVMTIASMLAMPAAKAQVNVGDSLALVQIYQSTGGSSWTSSTNWLTGPVATWQGVTVTGTRVTSLVLTFNNLTGSLPYHLGFLQELTALNLQGNNLSGSIPAALVFLQKLTSLNLSVNKFTGSIPVTLGLTFSLTSVNFSGNSLTGSIPATIGLLPNLRFLNLSGNQLSGSIPASIGFLKNLSVLTLNDNKLAGSIPATFAGLNRVSEVYIFNNKLSGSLPEAISGMDSIVFFNASNNKFTGAVPASVASLQFLYFFNVESNQIQDLPNLTSSTSLRQLYVASNKLTYVDIQPNLALVEDGSYIPQDSVGSNKTVTVCEGQPLVLPGNYIEASPDNSYTWFKTDFSFVSTSATQSITIPAATAANAGLYSVEIANSQVPNLLLYRRVVRVRVKACTSSAQTISTGDTKVFPVPFDESAMVEVAGEDARIVVSDSFGNVVQTVDTTDKSAEIGGGLKRGTYFVQSFHGGKKEVVRVVKN